MGINAPSPVYPGAPSPPWTSSGLARARRCIPPTGKSRRGARSARSQSKTTHFGKAQKTCRASGCSPRSSCSGSRAWFPPCAPGAKGTARVLHCTGHFSAFLVAPSFPTVYKKKTRRCSLYAKLMFAPTRVNFPLWFSPRGQRKSWSACERAFAGKLILARSACESNASCCPCYRAERLEMQTKTTGTNN